MIPSASSMSGDRDLTQTATSYIACLLSSPITTPRVQDGLCTGWGQSLSAWLDWIHLGGAPLGVSGVFPGSCIWVRSHPESEWHHPKVWKRVPNWTKGKQKGLEMAQQAKSLLNKPETWVWPLDPCMLSLVHIYARYLYPTTYNEVSNFLGKKWPATHWLSYPLLYSAPKTTPLRPCLPPVRSVSSDLWTNQRFPPLTVWGVATGRAFQSKGSKFVFPFWMSKWTV